MTSTRYIAEKRTVIICLSLLCPIWQIQFPNEKTHKATTSTNRWVNLKAEGGPVAALCVWFIDSKITRGMSMGS